MKYASLILLALICCAQQSYTPGKEDIARYQPGELSYYGGIDSFPSSQRVVPFPLSEAMKYKQVTGSHNTYIGRYAESKGLNNTIIGFGSGEFLTTQHDVFILGENIPAEGFANDSTIYIGNESTTITIRSDGSLSVGNLFIKKDPSLYESLRRCEQLIKAAYRQ